MFDLLGAFDFDQLEPLTLPAIALPALKWGQVRIAAHQVSGRGLAARYAEYGPGSPSYGLSHSLHLFAVGEARLRSDAALPIAFSKQARCLPLLASQLLALYEDDPDRFIHQLKGSFILVLVDERQRQATLYSSRFCILPFYYAASGRRLLFSTSLAAISQCLSPAPGLDEAGVAELALFNYPLGDRTYLRGIKMLRPAQRVTAEASGLRAEQHWDVRTLYDARMLPAREALDAGAVLFRGIVNDLASDMRRVRLSFTSGFDSRALLSVLDKEPGDYLGYSFGIPGSLNVTIPQQMARQLGLSYQPVLLDGDYERRFDEYARRAVMLSDCLSTVERANYPYAFERLAWFSPVVLTGLFGSELLRTFQNVGHIVSAGLVRLLKPSVHPCAELRQMLSEPGAVRYFAPQLLHRSVDAVEADLRSALVEPFGQLGPDRQFYMFLLTEGLRKYFGAELQTERPYGVTRTPFLDDEFVEFLFQAPFAGVHSRTLRPTVGNRYRSQRFYAHIIREHRPELLAAPTDHGYPPQDVLSPLALLLIGPKQWRARRWRRRSGYREFKTEEWTEALYRRHLFNKPCGEWLQPALQEDLQTGAWLARRLEFARAASLKLWLETLQSYGEA